MQGAEERKQAVARAMQALPHASVCRRVNCPEDNCLKFRLIIHHTKLCKGKLYGRCIICKQLMAFSVCHAKECKTKNCKVIYCDNLKMKLFGPDQAEVQ